MTAPGTFEKVGTAATASGWRASVAGVVAPRLAASRFPLDERQVRALAGWTFLALSVRHLVQTARRAARQPVSR